MGTQGQAANNAVEAHRRDEQPHTSMAEPGWQQLQPLYDEGYFSTGCGHAYGRTSHWCNFFSIIADELIRSLQPRRVLDAGCAMGLLVEAFWDRGIEAYGIDFSEYAISNVRPDILRYCRLGSITESIDGFYDLVTCIEVLEHIPAEQAQIAAANITRVTNTILFSSDPTDTQEPTHINVQPSIAWLRTFASLGFWPDTRYDAGFVTPHAFLLRRREDGVPQNPQDNLELLVNFSRYKRALLNKGSEISRLAETHAQSLAEFKALLEKNKELEDVGSRLAAVQEEISRQVVTLQVRGVEIEKLQNLNERLSGDTETLKAALEDAVRDRQNEVRNLQEQLNSKRHETSRGAEEDRAKTLRLRGELDRTKTQGHQRVLSGEPGTEQRITELRESLAQALGEVASLRGRASLAERRLQAVTESPAWRLVTSYRGWLRGVRDTNPRVFRFYERTIGSVLAGAPPQPERARQQKPEVPTPDPVHTGPAALIAGGESEARPSVTADPDYQLWIDQNEPGRRDLEKQRTEASTIPDGPLISIIVPVFNPEPSFLSECVSSVLLQSYERWELCVAHAAPYIDENREFLRQAAARDSRIKLVELEKNLGISGNTNEALSLAGGEYVAFLDHDDMIAPFALFSMARYLSAHPGTDLLYSDHDYLDSGNWLRRDPLFKPDWSPETMLSSCYITHLTLCRRCLVEDVGRCDPATDGAQDWDLYLKITDRTARIAHLPEILYHWRMHRGSTALNTPDTNAKPYAATAQRIAIQRHLDRTGIEAEPFVRPNGLLSIRWLKPLTSTISIIIPTKDKVDLLKKCVSSLLEKTSYTDYEVIIVDTGSQEAETHRYYESLLETRNVRVHQFPPPFNYSAANNFGVTKATGDLLLFLNNDIEIIEGEWLGEMAHWASLDPVGIVGAKLLFADGRLQHAGVVLGLGGFADHPFSGQEELHFGLAGSTGWYRNWLAVTGACMMMRREVFDRMGGFDESFILCGSDVEICLRAGQFQYRVVWTPFASLVHHERQTRGTHIPPGDFVASEQSYRPYLDMGDPYWSRNLSMWHPEGRFRLAGEQSSQDFIRSYLLSTGTADGGFPTASTAPPDLVQALPANLHEPCEEENIVAWFDYGEADIAALRKVWAGDRGFRDVKRLVWFIPAFDIAFYGGIFTILSFAEHWRRTKGVKSVFAVCGASTSAIMAARIGKVYRDCTKADVWILGQPHDVADLPPSDACVSTLWTTAFYALRYRKCSRHFYFIQDYEPMFYRAGSSSAIASSTYRLGFYGIANTISLRKTYEEEYGGSATHFTPCVNPALFHALGRKDPDARPWKVFVYARPQHARNSFELIAAAVRLLKAKLGERVTIVTAGAEWNVEDYGLSGIVEHLGLLAYEDTAALYRTCDVGVALMFTRHPSYLPLEFMASGTLVVANYNAWNDWFFKDGENCILSRPTSSCLAEAVERGLLDINQRARITRYALETIRRDHSDWSREMDRVYDFVCDPVSAEDLTGSRARVAGAESVG